MPTEHRILTAFPPVEPSSARLLILGSMPGVASLRAQQYYAHPRNAFWPIMQAILGDVGETYNTRLARLKSHHIALWDVCFQCERPGSLDSNIRNASVVCNDFDNFASRHPELRAIAFNGKAAEKLFTKHVLRKTRSHLTTGSTPRAWQGTHIPKLISLPSTSPAMASLTIAQKIDHWSQGLAGVLLPSSPHYS